MAKHKQSHSFFSKGMLLWITLFATIGVASLLFARADTASSSIEPETGILSGQVSISPTDTSASGNNAVLFGKSTPVQTATWTNVTPTNMDFKTGQCFNLGVDSIVIDPRKSSDLYTQNSCHGIWKSTDYGKTWNGPINTGPGGAESTDCSGGLSIAPGANAGSPPTIYNGCFNGPAMGLWRSRDGGVSWTKLNVSPNSGYQDTVNVVVDPYDGNHLLLAWHEFNLIVQSFDGGDTWTEVPMDPGMKFIVGTETGTADINFIDTGNAATTRTTWLFVPQTQNGRIGTWRTSNGGANWTNVNPYEKGHGGSQLYQPDTKGVLYMGGYTSAAKASAASLPAAGVLRSTDYGQHWTHVGADTNEVTLFGTSKYVYAMWSWAALGSIIDPAFQIAPQPGTSGWVDVATPAAMTLGAAEVAVTNDGTHNILVSANWDSGLWRYIEP